jgi:cephalosporin hydroxylase
MNLKQLKESWEDSEAFHTSIHEYFSDCVKNDELLNEHRTFVREKVWGFGEDSFPWLWKLIVDEMPSEFSFIEVGIFRGAILSLIDLLAIRTGRKVDRYGVTPLDVSGGVWPSDYKADIEFIHDSFFIPKDYTLYVGSSTNDRIVEQAYNSSPYDITYIDGSHEYLDVVSDLRNYAPMTKRGGYLVVDDAASRYSMPFGYFTGIADVCKALYEWEQTDLGKEFEFQYNVVHLMVYKRIK